MPIFFFLALIWLLRLLKNRKIKRYIENIPTSTLRSLAVGLSEVNGTIIKPSDGTILHSPFTNSECVWYRASVKVRKRRLVKSGSQRYKFKEIFFEGKYLNPFTIDDGTGLVNVDLEGANFPIKFKQDKGQRVKMGDNPIFDKFCADRKISMKGLFFKKVFTFTETFLEPGTNLYILGNAKNIPGSDKNRLTMCKDDYYKKLFTVSEKSESEVLKTKGGGTIALIASLLTVFVTLYFMADYIIDAYKISQPTQVIEKSTIKKEPYFKKSKGTGMGVDKILVYTFNSASTTSNIRDHAGSIDKNNSNLVDHIIICYYPENSERPGRKLSRSNNMLNAKKTIEETIENINYIYTFKHKQGTGNRLRAFIDCTKNSQKCNAIIKEKKNVWDRYEQ